MGAFDSSLKRLLQREPEDFIRFGLRGAPAHVVQSLPVDLPTPGRAVDGTYLVEYRGTRLVVHLEFHRRHQSLEELAVDVVEAQVRLYRRERLPVLSHVWDLYGRRDGPVVQAQTLHYGALRQEEHSLCVYHRVNLRALSWQEMHGLGLPGLWPLVALTRDGASAEGVQQARDAIQGRSELGAAGRADHLAVLSFVAEAEGVAMQALRSYIPKEAIMSSTLYQEILAEGQAQTKKEAVIRILTRRLGGLEPSVRQRIEALDSPEMLTRWYDEALEVVNAQEARKLLGKITQAPAT
jgi:hypothetical protein